MPLSHDSELVLLMPSTKHLKFWSFTRICILNPHQWLTFNIYSISNTVIKNNSKSILRHLRLLLCYAMCRINSFLLYRILFYNKCSAMQFAVKHTLLEACQTHIKATWAPSLVLVKPRREFCICKRTSSRSSFGQCLKYSHRTVCSREDSVNFLWIETIAWIQK